MKLNRWVFSWICSWALTFAAATAFAHGTGQHVLGTVTAIDETHIEIKTPKGATVTVLLDKNTKFKAKRAPKLNEPPEVGDRVVIEATKDQSKGLIATEVHYAAAKRVPPPVPPVEQHGSTPPPTTDRGQSVP